MLLRECVEGFETEIVLNRGKFNELLHFGLIPNSFAVELPEADISYLMIGKLALAAQIPPLHLHMSQLCNDAV